MSLTDTSATVNVSVGWGCDGIAVAISVVAGTRVCVSVG
jgi:hypothetical protein